MSATRWAENGPVRLIVGPVRSNIGPVPGKWVHLSQLMGTGGGYGEFLIYIMIKTLTIQKIQGHRRESVSFLYFFIYKMIKAFFV